MSSAMGRCCCMLIAFAFCLVMLVALQAANLLMPVRLADLPRLRCYTFCHGQAVRAAADVAHGAACRRAADNPFEAPAEWHRCREAATVAKRAPMQLAMVDLLLWMNGLPTTTNHTCDTETSNDCDTGADVPSAPSADGVPSEPPAASGGTPDDERP